MIELALEVATKMRPPATKIKIKALLSLFSGQPLPQPQPRSTCKSLDPYGPSYLQALDSMPEHVICCGEVCILYSFNTVDVIGAGVVLKLNDGSLRCLVRVRSRSQLAPGPGDHPW